MTHRADPEEGPHEVLRRGVGVRGVVLGVGFRPFVYRLAAEEGLTGWIGNDTDGVTIEIEGTEAGIEGFLKRLRAETPPLARIDAVAVSELEATGETGFRIVERGARAGEHGDSGGCGDVRGLFAGVIGSGRSAVPVSVFELHELRTSVHDYAADSV